MVLRRLRTWLIAGLAVLLPVWLTFVTLKWLFDVVDGALAGILTTLVGRHIPGIGLVITVVVVLLVGSLTNYFVGRQLIRWGDRFLLRVPIIRAVYGVLKQITDAVFGSNQQAFSKVALVELPVPGSYMLGFVTGEVAGFTNVWVPATPSPTSGFLMFIPTPKVRVLAMTVEEGLKMVISGGVFLPKDKGLEQFIAELNALSSKQVAGGADS